MDNKMLENKVIIITGGTKGIGRGVALGAAAEGAKVVIAGLEFEEGNSLVKKIENEYNQQAVFVQGDLKDLNNCKELVDITVNKFGRVDGLFNYAGTTSPGTLAETDENLYDYVLDLNMKSVFFITKYTLKVMQNNGGGSIVNAGSTHTYGGHIDRAAYATSKGALLAFTKHISKNYAKDKIRSNFLTIGWVATPSEKKLQEEQMGLEKGWEKRKGKELPMGRLQEVEDYVPGVIYLLSDYASQVTGTELHITGGFFA